MERSGVLAPALCGISGPPSIPIHSQHLPSPPQAYSSNPRAPPQVPDSQEGRSLRVACIRYLPSQSQPPTGTSIQFLAFPVPPPSSSASLNSRPPQALPLPLPPPPATKQSTAARRKAEATIRGAPSRPLHGACARGTGNQVRGTEVAARVCDSARYLRTRTAGATFCCASHAAPAHSL